MDTKIWSDFFRAIGHKVFSSQSSDWYEVQKGMLFSIPYHHLIDPSKDELDDLLERSGAIALRYPTHTTGFGFDSTLAMCDARGYSLDTLNRKVRNRVKKGAANFDVRQFDITELKMEALALNKITCARQNRNDPKTNINYWTRLCESVKSAGVIAVGAFAQERLGAYALVIETPPTVEIILQCSDTELLDLCPNNILTYEITRKYLEDPASQMVVSYGLGSLEETDSLDHFKIGMGYRLDAIKQCIYFRKKIGWIVNTPLLSFIESITKIGLHRNYYLRKGSCIIRRYLSQY
ncbi:MAG: hypothetical protein P4N41_17890 [Negativicutes bacterium]|nr:hypothetical protein [Negativicutes bacterium]